MSLLLGIDVGTTGIKAILINEKGELISSVITEYQFFTPFPLWAEQAPQDWWNAAKQSINKVLEKAGAKGKDIKGIGLTGQMHGLVLLDKFNKVTRPCIMWNDQRSAPQCASLTEKIGAEKVLELTGNKILPGFTLPKLIWVKENEPQVYERISKILLPKDYLRFCLSGKFFSDVSDSSGTSMFNVGKREWSTEILNELNIPIEWLPTVTESTIISSYVNKFASEETDLLEGTPIVSGAGDQAAQAFGSGIFSEGTISVTIGTSGVVFAAADKFYYEPEGRLHAFCHSVPDKWHYMGVMLSAGGSLKWYRDTFCNEEKLLAKEKGIDAYDLMMNDAEKIPAGSDGLIFLPYLSGERTPYPNPNARGVFFGATIRHTKAHFTRAVVEGVTFGLLDSLELLKEQNISIKQARASGGGAQSKLWRQILADVFNTEIVTVNVTEGAAYGAALLAGIGTKVIPDIDYISNNIIKVTSSTQPSANSEIYKKYYPRYRNLYKSLEKEFDLITELNAK
ncbi:MAG: xylulokinase [Ignavibacteriales bacterium]|nr:xylulokinase [Ignavibacteriales bacterium]